MDGGGRTRDGGSVGSSIGVVGGQQRPRSTRWRLNRVVDAQTRRAVCLSVPRTPLTPTAAALSAQVEATQKRPWRTQKVADESPM